MNSPFITIVSGLPRSGTSMMMQALEAGGIQPLTDNIRTADADNPRGYYEYEPVKQTKQDASWLADAAGKVVKMVYRLLYDLPQGHKYRVIFMQRDFSEMLKSQKKMLIRSGKEAGDTSDEKLTEMFKNQIEQFDNWIVKQNNFAIIKVNYADVIANPRPEFRRISEFLDGKLNIGAMTATVEISLYRNRSENTQ